MTHRNPSEDDDNDGIPARSIAHLFLANYSPDSAKVVVGVKTYWFPPHSRYFIKVLSEGDSAKMQAWIGEQLVMDTIIGVGRYIGSLSSDSYVFAEQVTYVPVEGRMNKREGLSSFMVSEPGIERFDKGFEIEAFGFDSEVPTYVYGQGDTRNKWESRSLIMQR